LLGELDFLSNCRRRDHPAHPEPWDEGLRHTAQIDDSIFCVGRFDRTRVGLGGRVLEVQAAVLQDAAIVTVEQADGNRFELVPRKELACGISGGERDQIRDAAGERACLADGRFLEALCRGGEKALVIQRGWLL
jgi:hypothetical protein